MTRQRQVGHSIAARAQWAGIRLKHSFPRQLFSHWLISCQILALIGLLFASRPTHGQDPRPATTLSVDVKVVTLPVTVRDKHGQIVRNLTKDDFLLEEDGHPQSIRYFAQEANLPLTLGLLVDTSMSQRNVLDQERTASESFLNQMLTAAKDQAFIIHFDREVELLQDLTSSRDKLQTALASLQTPKSERDSGGGGESPPDSSPGRSRRMHGGGGTLLYDAVFLASDELMKKQQGRKALIVLSDGVDRGSKESLQSAIEAAQRADTVVYSIFFADNHPRWSIPSCLLITIKESAAASADPVAGGLAEVGPVAEAGQAEVPEVEVAEAVVSVLLKRPGLMGRKFSSKFPKRQAAVSTKSPRRRRSIKSMGALQRNCARSTAWATHPTKPTMPLATTRSA